MFSFNSSKISVLHKCNISGLCLMQSVKWGASITLSEEDGVSKLPTGFQCTLPDGSQWAVKNGNWLQVSMPKQAKASLMGKVAKLAGGAICQ